MEQLQFNLVTQKVERGGFDCGNKTINGYIRDSYYPLLTQIAYTYEISGHARILGYCQVLFRCIALNEFPDDICDYDPGLREGKVTAVYLRFIAVEKKYHRHGIGSEILRSMIKRVQQLTEKWPVKVIVIDAVTDKIEWYERFGFRKMKSNSPGQEGVTEAMYYKCERFSKELKEYQNI